MHLLNALLSKRNLKVIPIFQISFVSVKKLPSAQETSQGTFCL